MVAKEGLEPPHADFRNRQSLKHFPEVWKPRRRHGLDERERAYLVDPNVRIGSIAARPLRVESGHIFDHRIGGASRLSLS